MNSNNSPLVQTVETKIQAYKRVLAEISKEKETLENRLNESRWTSMNQEQRSLRTTQGTLNVLTGCPVALHPGEDRRRRKDAASRPFTTLETQLYGIKDTNRRLLIALLICFVIGLLCILIRQSDLTILCGMICVSLFFILKYRRKRFGGKKQQVLREHIIREWTSNRSSLQQTIQHYTNRIVRDTDEQRDMSHHIQSLTTHLQRTTLDLTLAQETLVRAKAQEEANLARKREQEKANLARKREQEEVALLKAQQDLFMTHFKMELKRAPDSIFVGSEFIDSIKVITHRNF